MMAAAEDTRMARFWSNPRVQMMVGTFFCGVYIIISASLINFNKLLMDKAYFPFSTMLTTIHMTVSFACSLVLYCMAPSLFPSMEATAGKRFQILKYFLPLACLFAVGVVLSNQAYKYCSVAFLQFMKQGNVCIVFGLSCLVGSQVCDRMKFLIVCWITCGSAMAVTGEIHFVLVGFLIQVTSQFGECGKNILQEWILRGSDVKLDPLTYNLFISPCCLVVLAAANVFTYDPQIPERFLMHWHLLLPNALVAFSLNVTISIVIKQTSAMGFILAGVVKDMVIVIASTRLFGDTLASQQILGFSIATFGIFMWSFIRVQPSHPVVTLLAKFLGMPCSDDEKSSPSDAEKQPLLRSKV